LAAFSILLWIWQRAQPTASNLWALSIFLIAGLTVWVVTSRRLTRHSTEVEGPPEVSDTPATMHAPPPGVAEESCAVCALPVSGSDKRCKCGAPRLTDADRQRLHGPGGWLAVCRFVLLVLAPLDVAVVIATWLANGSDFSTGDWLRVLPEILLVAGLALYGVFVAALLTNERPESVRHARQYLAGKVICQVALIVHVGLRDGAPAAAGLMFYLLGVLVVAYAWLRYFRRSRRVLVTYGPGALRSGVSVPTLALGTLAAACVVLVPLVTLRILWPSTEGEWSLYAPATGGFRLELPAAPSLTEETFTEPDGTVSVLSTAQVETWDGLVFSVSHEELPIDADVSDEASILDAMRDGAIESAVLQQGQAVVVQGVSGREFVAHDAKRQFSLAGRVFLVDRKTITLMAVTPGTRTPAHVRAADRFLKSFAITEQ
jgi:hypothetical protein